MATSLQVWEGLLNEEHRPPHVDVEDVLPFLSRVVSNSLLGTDTRVVDHNIDASERSYRFYDNCGDVPETSHISGNAKGLTAENAQVFLGLLTGIASRPTTTTCAPAQTNPSAKARPMPRVPPVMTTTRPSISNKPWSCALFMQSPSGMSSHRAQLLAMHSPSRTASSISRDIGPTAIISPLQYNIPYRTWTFANITLVRLFGRGACR